MFEAVLAEEVLETVATAPRRRSRRLDPERTALVAELPESLRTAIVDLADERGQAPEALIEELVEREAQRK